MKFMDMDVHGFFGISSGRNSLYGQCLGILEWEQMSQVVTNSLTDFHICGHQKFLEISSMVLLKPKCPADGKSCRD